MMNLNCNIRIGNYSFQHVVDLVVNTSIEQLTDTCKIELPRKLSWQGKTIALGEDGLLRAGNRVSVKAGYGDNLQTVFKGYLKHIKPGIRVELTCENETYNLKKNVINKSYKSTDLSGLLNDILPNSIVYKAVNLELGQIIINNMNAAKVLEQLQTDFGIFSYFKYDPVAGIEVLYSGFAYWADDAATHKLRFKHNIIDDKSLEFIREEDVKLKVKAVSIQKNNTRIEKEIGDADGDLRTLFFYDVPGTDLEALATAEMQKLKYTGLQGSLMAFGEPYVTKGDVVEISDPDYPEKDGSYLVKSVEYRFGTRGYRQKIELGPKV